ncbi:hypothetical protein ACFX2B_014078 [Malus domestica]
MDSSTSSSAEAVSVNDFGAESHGETDDTKVINYIQMIIYSCNKKITITVGLVYGTLWFKKGAKLYVTTNAVRIKTWQEGQEVQATSDLRT